MHIELLGVQDDQVGDRVQLELDGHGSLTGAGRQVGMVVHLVLDGRQFRGQAPFDLRGRKVYLISTPSIMGFGPIK